MSRALSAIVPLLLLPALPRAQDAEPVDDRPLVRLENAFPGQKRFDKPLYLEWHATDPDGCYVVTQPGVIHRIPRDGTSGDRRTFLDLSQRVLTENWEEGLLGFAFDPDYASNGWCYAYWSEQVSMREVERRGKMVKLIERRSVISRFGTGVDADGNRAVDLGDELRVMVIPQPFGNHNGGTIVFGPDRMLYVALGDGGAADDPQGNGQDKGSLLGKILRIDVTGATAEQPYRVPADNPFVGEEGARPEIWAWGLRNPWRITFDRQTGELWCGDVGQNRLEEVDRIVKGGNYGWNFMEGTERFRGGRQRGEPPADLIPPVAEYGRREGQSVTGGYVYRGSLLPELQGWFVYGDFHTFRMWAVKEDREGGAHRVRAIGRAPNLLASFAEAPDGELLVLCYDGRIYRMVPAGEGG